MVTDFLRQPSGNVRWSPQGPDRTGDATGPPIRVINVRLLAGTLAAILVVVPTAYYWHGFQVRRNSTVLLRRAEKASKQQAWKEAIGFYQRYVQLRPHDVEGRIGLATTIDKAARSRADKRYAWRCYAQALGLAPQRVDLHRRYAELSLELGALTPARDEAEKVLRFKPGDAVGLRVKALAGYQVAAGTGRTDRLPAIVKDFEAALKAKPDDVELALQLAGILRGRTQDPASAQLADEVVDRMVAANPGQAKALLGRYEYRRQFRLGGADEDLDAAIELASQDVAVLLAAAERALRQARLGGARDFCQRAMDADPHSAEAYLAAGKVFMAMGRRDEALDVWQRGLHQAGSDHLLLNLELTRGLLAVRRFKDAEEHLRRAEEAWRDLALQLPDEQHRHIENLQGTVFYLRAYLEAEAGNYFAAVPMFEKALVLFKAPDHDSPEALQRFQTLTQLAECYTHLEEWDLAAGMYQEASVLQPHSLQPVLAAGQVWERAGRFDLASEKYEQVLNSGRASVEDWTAWAYNKLQHQLTLPAGDRSFAECESILKKARDHGANSPRLELLEADLHALHGQKREAIAIAERMRDKEPNSLERWQFLTLGYQQWGQPAKALQAVEEFKKLPDVSRLDSLLLESELLSLRKEQAQAEKVLRDGMAELSDDQRAQATVRLISVLLEQGKRSEALQVASDLARRHPTNIEYAQRCAEIAWESDDMASLAPLEARLEKLEGSSGSWWRFYRAERALDSAGSANSRALREASRLLDEIAVRRPRWSRTALLKGDVARSERRTADALANYQNALDEGDVSLNVLERAVGLLYAESRFGEAEQFLATYGNPIMRSPELSLLAISLSVSQGRTEEAIGRARDAVRRWPDSAKQYVWLGQVLSLARQNDEAEDAFRSAIQHAPAMADGWAGLLSFLLRTGQSEKARLVLRDLAKATEVPAARREFILAQGFERLGQANEAQRYYVAAATHGANDASIQLQTAIHFVNRNAVQAEKYLRQAIKIDPRDPRARVLLAQIVFAHGGDVAWQEAMRLVSGPDATPEEVRTRVDLLLGRPGIDHRRQAIQLLEALVQRPQQAVIGDRLRLARLYEDQGHVDRAGQLLAATAAPDSAEPREIVEFAAFCLRHDRPQEAGAALARLKKKDPENIDALRIEAQWLCATNRKNEVEKVLQPMLAGQLAIMSDGAAKARRACEVAQIYALVRLSEPAERAFRQAMEFDGSDFQPYARWLAGEGRVKEAAELTVSRITDDTLGTSAIFLATLLSAHPESKDAAALAEPVLSRALRAFPKSIDLLNAMAGLRERQGDADAERLSRRILELQPNHVGALARLASALTPRSDMRNEAMSLIQRAIRIAGRRPDLLDTLGMILLYEGKARDAASVLSEAVGYSDCDPRCHVHLALAYQRLRATKEAKEALARAESKHVDELAISASERELLLQLQRELNQ